MSGLQKDFVEHVPGVFSLIRPAGALPLVFDSPHSGAEYPEDFDYACDFAALEKAEDKYVDELFADAPEVGAALLAAHFPRSYIDANRCGRDIDLELLADVWPEEVDPAGRSHAGIGLVRRLVKPGMPLYARTLTSAEIQARIDRYYAPYHAALKQLLDEAYYAYGQVWHINCHSMPTAETAAFRANPLKPVDFVLGDRDGTSCDPAFTRAARDFFKDLGYAVAINDPYKGVELVSRYSDPLRHRHSLQIEIARNLYLDEQTYKKTRDFEVIRRDMAHFALFCADYIKSQSFLIAAD